MRTRSGTPSARSREGWFILNAREARLRQRPGRGKSLGIQGDTDFPQVGIGLVVLEPGEPIATYHWATDQEDFLVLSGDPTHHRGAGAAVTAVGFRPLPRQTRHVIVGAGHGPCAVLAIGAREHHTTWGPDSKLQAAEDWGANTVDEAALRHGAGV